MSGSGARESTTWQYPCPKDADAELDLDVDDDDEDGDDDEHDYDEEEDDDDEDSDDEHDNRQPKSHPQSVTRKRVANPLARILKENSRSESGADAVAAFQRYSLRSEANETRMVEYSDLQVPAEHLTRLLDPISSDARVRAYFRGVSEEIDKKATVPEKVDDYAQMAAQLIFGIMQREIARSRPKREHATRELRALAVPDLQYALAKALLASNRVKDATSQLQEALVSAESQEDHVVSQACQRLLVHAWRKNGEPGKAIALLYHMIEQQRVNLDADHPSILSLQHALAAAYENDQNSHQAVSLLKQMACVQNKLRGQQYPSQLITLHLLLRSQTNAEQRVDANTTISSIVDVIRRFNVPISPLQAISQSADLSVPSAQHEWDDYSRPQIPQWDHVASNVLDSSIDNSSLQRLIDHLISSRPPDTGVPSELQDRIQVYNSLKQASMKAQPFNVTTGSHERQHAQLVHMPLSSTPRYSQAVSKTTVAAASSPLVEITTAGAAYASQSTALAAAAIGISGTIGMVAAWLAKLYLVDKPQLQLMQRTESREQMKTDAELKLKRQSELREQRKDDAEMELKRRREESTEHTERLNIIKTLAMAEEELIRKEADTAEREIKLKQTSERYKCQIGELRKQVDAKEEERQAEYQKNIQQSKQSADHQSQQAERIKCLEEQLQQHKRSEVSQSQQAEKIQYLERKLQHSRHSEETQSQQANEIVRLEEQLRQSKRSGESWSQELSACRAALSKAEDRRERNTCFACQRSGREEAEDVQRANEPRNDESKVAEDNQDFSKPDNDPQSPEPDEDRDFAGSAYEMDVLRPAAVRSELERELRSVVEAKDAAEESSNRLQGELDIAEAKVETQQSELDALELQLVAMQCEHEQSEILLAARLAACRCGDSPNVEACLPCEKSRSIVRALWENLSGQDFGGKEVRFLRGLDSAHNIDELVAILCARLEEFVRTLYKDLLPLHENNSRGLEAKLRDADEIIAEYQDRLASSQCKESRLEHQLRKAQSELNEVLAQPKGYGNSPAQQKPVLRATSWIDLRWPFSRETKK